MELLGEIILNPAHEAVSHEALKSTIHKNASSMDPFTVSSEAIHYTSYRVLIYLFRITISDSLQLVLRIMCIQLHLNKSKNSTIISTLERILLSVVLDKLTDRHLLLKLVLISVRFLLLECQWYLIVINLSSLLLCCSRETMRCSTLLFQLLLRLPAGTILTSSP